MTSDEIIDRARSICAAAHGIVPGFCRQCAKDALAEHLAPFKDRSFDEPGIKTELALHLAGIPDALLDAYFGDLAERARRRCSGHRGATIGFCGLCYRLETEDLLAVENPTMKRDDVGKLVDEWILAADSPKN